MGALQTFLVVMGAFLAAIALFVLILVAWVWRKFRSMVRTLSESVEKYGAVGALVRPLRIHLRPRDVDDSWSNEAEVDHITEALVEGGMQRLVDYEAEELLGFLLRGFCDPQRRLYGVVYDHVHAGVWFDLVSFYADGRVVTFTTNPPTGLSRPPFLTIENHPGAEPLELLEHCLATRPAEGLLPTPPEEFIGRFEQTHAREMDWRVECGGPSDDEIRRIAGKDGEVDQETIDMIRGAWRSQINEHFNGQLREAYLDQSGLSARRWEEVRDRLFFVHDRLTADDLLCQCEYVLVDPFYEQDGNGEEADHGFDEERMEQRREEVRRALQGASSRQGFARFNQTLPQKCRFQKIGEMTDPIPADVYLQPDWGE